jgi:hypothetical protein
MDEGLVFDIGMHRGEDTAYYLWRGYCVVGFEASPALVNLCRARFTHEITAGRLAIWPGVLRGIDTCNHQTFFVNRDHSDWGTADPAWRDRNAGTFGAPSEALLIAPVRLADALHDVGVPCYAKIDIEGLDREVLAAFAEHPERPAFISIESSKGCWDALAGEIDLLASLGYRRFAPVQQRTIPGSTLHGFTFERHASGPFGDDVAGWTDRAGILARYRRIFRSYEAWGDASWLQKRLGRSPIAALQALVRRPLPGWYDTHARLR